MQILITISYDGTNYHGWQKQAEAIAVQQKVEEALSLLYKKEIVILGASRTDSGVHAKGQVATFFAESPENSTSLIPPNKIPLAINPILGKLNCPDIIVTNGIYVDDDFHPQHSAIEKTYSYTILNSRFNDPLLRNYTWHIREELDITKMIEASKYFLGTRDFDSFRASGGQAKTSTRTIYNIEISSIILNDNNDKKIIISITGNGFLYNMVRIISGTLMYVGKGKINPSEIENIILSKDRKNAGITAPPQGLCLMNIKYNM